MENWDDDDERGFSGHDVYLGDEDEVPPDPEDLVQDDEDITEGTNVAFEGIEEQRQSIMTLLNSGFVSFIPSSQRVNAPAGGPASPFTLQQIRMLLEAARARGLRASIIPAQDDDDDEDDDEDYVPEDDDDAYGAPHYFWSRSRETQPQKWFEPVTEPQETGLKLLKNGDFGRLRAKKQSNIRRLLKQREMSLNGRGKGSYKEDFSQSLIPNVDGSIVASYGANAYSGQYSTDSSFYYTCCQDFYLHVYDTKAPVNAPAHPSHPSQRRAYDSHTGHETTMKTIQSVQAVAGSWTITDSHLSPDNERLIYSSMSSHVYMTKTFETESRHTILNFGHHRRNRGGYDWDDDDIRIYSCRFSADGNEVVAGGRAYGGEIRVYDLLADRCTTSIRAHGSDVNSCCWADSSSGNVLISASDDTFVKVWDRRSLGSSQKPSGVLVGHTEGITYVSPKGDGRYVISNGKDQAIRLWDLRKMHSNTEFEKFAHTNYGHGRFDYRYGQYVKPRHLTHPKDCSVMIYRGHRVLRTLIRCHFSPMETTGSNYLYTGSSDGKIHIYSLDGRIVQILDRAHTLPMTFDPSEPEPESLRGNRGRQPVCVRDVSWHSQEPVLMSVAWENAVSNSSVARHEWKGVGKLGDRMAKLEDYVERQKLERDERARRRDARRAQNSRMPGTFEDDD